MSYHRLDLVNQSISSLDGLTDLSSLGLVIIDLRRNRLQSFDGFGRHTSLRELDLRDNQITSLRGLTRQESLERIRLEGNPIADHVLYRIMILLTVGYSVKLIDGKSVCQTEISMASGLVHAALAVSCGWILDLVPRSKSQYQLLAEELLIAAKRMETGTHEVTISSVLHRWEDLSVRNTKVKQITSSSSSMVSKEEVVPEVAYAAVIEFDSGIYLTTSLHPEERILGAIRFRNASICGLDFLRKRVLVELDVKHASLSSGEGRSIMFSGAYGVACTAYFLNEGVQTAVVKTFYSRRNAALRCWNNDSAPIPAVEPSTVTTSWKAVSHADPAAVKSRTSTSSRSSRRGTRSVPVVAPIVGSSIAGAPSAGDSAVVAPSARGSIAGAPSAGTSVVGAPSARGSIAGAPSAGDSAVGAFRQGLLESDTSVVASESGMRGQEILNEASSVQEIDLEERDDQSRGTLNEPESDDGGVKTPVVIPPVAHSASVQDRFRAFMIDSDSDSD